MLSGKTLSQGLFVIFLLSAAIQLGSPSVSMSQTSGRRQRRDFVEGMLRQLIDSQLPSTNRAEPNREANFSQVGGKMREVRDALEEFSRAVSDLAQQLHSDANRIGGVRHLLSESLQVSASSTVLLRRANRTREVSDIIRDYRELDQAWRLLSFRLGQVRGLSAQAVRLIAAANRADTRLGELMQVNPQFDRAELDRQLAALSNDILNLLEDIDLGVDDSTQRYDLLVEGRSVFMQIRRVMRMVKIDSSYDDVRSEYERFQSIWRPFAERVRSIDDRYVARELRRVQQAARAIQELLWLPTEMDRQQLVYITRRLQSDTNDLIDNISLRQLVQMSRGSEGFVSSASEFYTACEDFIECVNNGDDDETLSDLYYYLSDEWQSFGNLVQQVNTSDARRKYREIDYAINEFRDLLGVQLIFDRQKGVQLAAALESMAKYYEADMKKIVRAGRFSPDFSRSCLQVSEAFRRSAQSLHSGMVKGENPQVLRAKSDKLAQNWESLVAHTTRLPQTYQNRLYNLRRRTTPYVVDVQSMLSL